MPKILTPAMCGLGLLLHNHALQAASLPALAAPNFTEYFNVGLQSGEGEAKEVSNSPTSSNFQYYASDTYYGTSGSGALVISSDPSPQITAVTHVYSPKDADEVSASASATLTYQIEFIGRAGIVPVEVSAKGSTSVSGTPGLFVSPGNNYAGAKFSVAGANVSINKSIFTELTGNIDSDRFSFGSEYNFVANSVYTISINALSSNLVFGHDDAGTAIASAYIDPTFSIDPSYTSDYMVDISAGIGNSVSSVPLPASASMFGAALVALGVVGYGMNRRGQPQVA